MLKDYVILINAKKEVIKMPNDNKLNPVEAILSQIRTKLLEGTAAGEKVPSSLEDIHLFLLKHGNLPSLESGTFGKNEMNNLPLNATVLLDGPEGQTICRRVPGGWIYSMIYNNTSVFVSKFE